ncbi:MAG TPA: 23S rRNA (pseudouridine(1915)-N(3))-methyltransferase RlmH [Candidatus Acidoferrales bacterium]|nr:23S rRNA (pseudouridine(1915)-N(3))-methyltransferase RlmH [Candidatus Acidoferrales bacterium]
MRIRLIMLGKTRAPSIRVLLDHYVRLIGHYTEIVLTELPSRSPAALRKVKWGPAALAVLVDRPGQQFSSERFAHWLGDLRDRGTREIVFLCGDAEGFPDELRRQTSQKISLSSFTMQHELARVVLAEQIYRALTILAGHPYSK